MNLHGVFRLRVGVLEGLYLWTYETHTLITDQTEVRNAENVRKWHFFVNKKNVLCVYRSDYRKSLLGQIMRILLKIEQNCRLFLDIFSSATVNDLFMTFTSRLMVDATCVYQQ